MFPSNVVGIIADFCWSATRAIQLISYDLSWKREKTLYAANEDGSLAWFFDSYDQHMELIRTDVDPAIIAPIAEYGELVMMDTGWDSDFRYQFMLKCLGSVSGPIHMLIQSEYRVHNKNDKSVPLPTMTILKTVELNPLPVMKWWQRFGDFWNGNTRIPEVVMPISFNVQHVPNTADVIYIARYNDRPGIRVSSTNLKGEKWCTTVYPQSDTIRNEVGFYNRDTVLRVADKLIDISNGRNVKIKIRKDERDSSPNGEKVVLPLLSEPVQWVQVNPSPNGKYAAVTFHTKDGGGTAGVFHVSSKVWIYLLYVFDKHVQFSWSPDSRTLLMNVKNAQPSGPMVTSTDSLAVIRVRIYNEALQMF